MFLFLIAVYNQKLEKCNLHLHQKLQKDESKPCPKLDSLKFGAFTAETTEKDDALIICWLNLRNKYYLEKPVYFCLLDLMPAKGLDSLTFQLYCYPRFL